MTLAEPRPLVIRPLLRDTALEVATLAQGAQATDTARLRARCLGLIDSFDQQLEEAGVSADTRREATYAQCALLDETVMMHLPADQKVDWDAQPLQVIRFGDHDAGNRVFDRLLARMREPAANIELLAAYAAILGLGFKGRYALEGTAERQALAERLDGLIDKYHTSPDPNLVILGGGPGIWTRLKSRLTLSAVAAICVVAVFVTYLVLNSSLDAQVAHLAQAAR